MCFFRQKKRRARKGGSALRLLACCYLIVPSPPIRAVISSIRSSGKGGSHRGFNAMDMSFMVIGGDTVGAQHTAALAAVDDGPFAALAHPDRNWL